LWAWLEKKLVLRLMASQSTMRNLPPTLKGRKSAFDKVAGRDAALRRPVGAAARRPYQKLFCAR
jgi:hypothetical protein